eukprot:SAG31_NODE_3963_length_3716_cov_3.038430_3_plen_298_part_00
MCACRIRLSANHGATTTLTCRRSDGVSSCKPLLKACITIPPLPRMEREQSKCATAKRHESSALKTSTVLPSGAVVEIFCRRVQRARKHRGERLSDITGRERLSDPEEHSGDDDESHWMQSPPDWGSHPLRVAYGPLGGGMLTEGAHLFDASRGVGMLESESRPQQQIRRQWSAPTRGLPPSHSFSTTRLSIPTTRHSNMVISRGCMNSVIGFQLTVTRSAHTSHARAVSNAMPRPKVSFFRLSQISSTTPQVTPKGPQLCRELSFVTQRVTVIRMAHQRAALFVSPKDDQCTRPAVI